MDFFKTVLADAIRDKNIKQIARLADYARSTGMNYKQLQERACAVGNIDANEWESLLFEADMAESEE